MIKAFRELYRFFCEHHMRNFIPTVILEFKNERDFYHFQWEMNKNLTFENPLDVRSGTIYGIPFELKVKNEKH